MGSLMDDLLEIVESSEEKDFDRSQIIRAPFGYLGNKLPDLEHILPKMPRRDKYIEVFGGSGAILLNKSPSKMEVFNDASSGVTAFFRCFKDDNLYQKLKERVDFTLRSREEFVWSRDTWKNCQDIVERAARWFYTIQNSFNHKGDSFRRPTHTVCVDAPLDKFLNFFEPVYQRLKKVYIENLDWEQCIKDFDGSSTVFYLDPPYYAEQNPYQGSFNKNDHRRMLDLIFQSRGVFVLSGTSNELYREYGWHEVYCWTRDRKAAGNVDLDTFEPVTLRETHEYLWVLYND